MRKELILLVIASDDLARELSRELAGEGFGVVRSSKAQGSRELAVDHRPVAAVIEQDLPDLDGVKLAGELRQVFGLSGIGLLLMANACSVESCVASGVDDCVYPPFNMRALSDRLKSVLARRRLRDAFPKGLRIEHRELVIDTDRFSVTVAGRDVPLTLAKFRLLVALASQPGRVFTREELVRKIGREGYIRERSIDTHVREIRKMLGPARELIETVRGIGYKLQA